MTGMPGDIPKSFEAPETALSAGRIERGGVNQVLKATRAAALPLRAILCGSTLLAGTGGAAAQHVGWLHFSGELTSLQVIEISMFLGAMGAALLSAVWMIRERGKVAGENLALRARIADLTASLERSDALLASRDARIAIWDSKADKPELVGSMPPSSGVPSERSHFLAFGRWMTPQSAAQIDRSLQALRSRGTAFEFTGETITGQMIDIQGRRTGTTSYIRFVGLSDLQAQVARLKQDASEMKATNSLFLTLLDSIPFPVWRREADGAVSWTNKAYLGLVSKDLLRKTGKLQQGQQAELFGTQARDLIERKRQADGLFEDKVATVIDGDRRVFDVHDVAVAGTSAGIARDISELEALKEEYERTLRSQSDTLNQLTTAVAIFDSGQKLRSFNNAFQKLWDLDVPFLESAPEHGHVLDRLRTDGRLPEQPEWRRWREQVLSVYRAPEGFEDWWHLPDGKTLRVLANPQPKGGAILVFENMTEKFDLETRYNTLIRVQGETLDNLAEGVAVFGSDGKIRLSNPAFAGLWNLPPDMTKEGTHISAIRTACKDKVPDAIWGGFVAIATGFDDARESRQGQFELNSGAVLAYAQVPLPKGQTMLTFIDVTDTANVERALKDKNEALQRAEMLKNDFIQHVSYELRSPLTNIIGFTELLQQPSTGPLNERQCDYLDHIATSSSLLLTTVNDILDLATVDAGIMGLDVAEIDLADLFASLETSFAGRFAESSVELKAAVDSTISGFRADAQRLRQVIGNLLSNAANHAPEGSTVTLSAKADGADVVISIHDEGPGIPADVIASVFDRFVARGSGGRRGGAGLGLSIVKGLVELHRGSVSIQSAPETGTTVECRFPADPSRFREAAE
jgi:signal transduction histidine kinase/PAS domain-containing protein